MNKRELLIEKYIIDLEKYFDEVANLKVLTAITIGCGPSIYNMDSSTVSSLEQKEIDTVKNQFLIKKLGLDDHDELYEAIHNVLKIYGRTNRKKYRVVVYYMLTKYFNKFENYN